MECNCSAALWPVLANDPEDALSVLHQTTCSAFGPLEWSKMRVKVSRKGIYLIYGLVRDESDRAAVFLTGSPSGEDQRREKSNKSQISRTMFMLPTYVAKSLFLRPFLCLCGKVMQDVGWLWLLRKNPNQLIVPKQWVIIFGQLSRSGHGVKKSPKFTFYHQTCLVSKGMVRHVGKCTHSLSCRDLDDKIDTNLVSVQ